VEPAKWEREKLGPHPAMNFIEVLQTQQPAGVLEQKLSMESDGHRLATNESSLHAILWSIIILFQQEERQ
jgi:hypothetical protein